MDKPIKVAQVLGVVGAGGVESVIMNYYRHIDKSKVQFDFFVENTSTIVDEEYIKSQGGNIIIIPHYTHIFKYLSYLKKKFKEGNYDVVHSNNTAMAVFDLFAAKMAGIKVRICHGHSTSSPTEWKRNFIKDLLRPFSKVFATHYFACSEYAGRWLFGDKTFDEGKVTVIYNAVDLERFKFNPEKRREVREKLGIKDDLVIGNIGRFVDQKNQAFLLDIFVEVLKRRKDAKLILLGEGPLKDMLVEKAERLGIKENILFEGITKQPENYYNAMDVFCLPSLYEGLPVVAVEAQDNGLKCVLSEEITKEVEILKTTDLVKLEDGAENWSEKIIKDEDFVREEGYKILCESKFSIKAQAEELNRKYEEMKQSGGGVTVLICRPVHTTLIGNIGRFMPQKNQLFLIDVMKLYSKGKLLLIGDGPLEEDIRRKAKEDNVDLIILPPTKEIQDYYNAMDCFAFPSIYEGLGMVLIEAQINGLNCIASTAVPKVADITGNVAFEDLDVIKWIKNINPNRKNLKIENNAFDINKQVTNLENLYHLIVNN